MPFIGITSEGLKISASPTLISLVNPIITFSVTVALLMCLWKFYTFKEVKVNPTDDDHRLEDIPAWTKLEIVVTILAAVTIVVSIVTIFITTSRIVTLNCVLALLFPPYAAFQEQKLTECKAMEEEIEVKEHEMDNLEDENKRLEEAQNNYKQSAAKLQVFADVYEELQTMGAVSLEDLEEQLKQKQEVIDNMKESKLDIVLGNVFNILVSLDKDESLTLSDDEIESIIKKIEEIDKVEINDELARKMIIGAGRSVHAVMKLAEDLLRDEAKGTKDTDKIIRIL